MIICIHKILRRFYRNVIETLNLRSCTRVLFRHLSSQLTEMEKLVDKMLSTEFQRYATADLNRPLGGENTVLDGVSVAHNFSCAAPAILRW